MQKLFLKDKMSDGGLHNRKMSRGIQQFGIFTSQDFFFFIFERKTDNHTIMALPPQVRNGRKIRERRSGMLRSDSSEPALL